MFANLDYGIKQAIVICATLIIGIAISFVATPFVVRFAKKIGAVDVPKDNRRMHNHPIPLLGGIAIIISFMVTSTAMMHFHGLLLEILPGALLIALLGVADDKFNLKPWPRLLVQCIAAALPIIANKNLIITSISGFNIFGIRTIYFGVFSIPITIIWIVGITNAMNFIDGLDGLSCGIATISSVSMLIIALIKLNQAPLEYGVTILTAALAGSCLGYLPYNTNPAKVFMGDTGSTFLGYTLSVISIDGLFKSYAVVSFAVPLLVLSLPILDTAVAIVRRISHGRAPWVADRSHIHHKLIDLGLDQKQTVGILYVVSGILGIVAITFAAFGSSTGFFVLIGGLVFITLFCVLTIKLCIKHNQEEKLESEESKDEKNKE